MKKLSIFLMAFLCLAVFAGGAVAKKGTQGGQISTAEATKFGYVDLNRALNEVDEGKSAKAKLEADGRAKKKKLEIMQNELKKMKEDLDSQRLILSAEALRAKETKLQEKLIELQKMSVEFEQDFAKKEADYIKPISDKLKRVINDIGVRNGYTMIVPREMALYSPPGTDLTDEVITAYNKFK